jgi:hypothetical protein
LDTSELYRVFANREAAGSSPIYEQLALAVADDVRLIDRLDRLPEQKRQPNLLFSSCRYLAAALGEAAATIEFIEERWLDLEPVLRSRSTQTNEAARTAVFLPVLAALPQPLALVEIGAAAGLCLYPDRYRISYDGGPPIGPAHSAVRIDVGTNGMVPPIERTPEVVARVGIDLKPLDVRNPDDLAWLDACIWPEHTDRVARLHHAATVVADDPPVLVRGDLVEQLDTVLDDLSTKTDAATTVVFHSAVLAYLSTDDRRTVGTRLTRRDTVWLSNEAPGVVAGLNRPRLPSVSPGLGFVVGRDGREVLALSHPHGRWLHWMAGEPV